MGSLKPWLVGGASTLALGLLLHIVGLSTPHWMEFSFGGANQGLWSYCFLSECTDFTNNVSSKVKAVRAMVILGMLCGLAAVVSVSGIMYNTHKGKTVNKNMPDICLAGGIGALVFILIGVIVYGTSIYDSKKDAVDLGYSFVLCIVGMILMPVGGGIVHSKGKA